MIAIAIVIVATIICILVGIELASKLAVSWAKSKRRLPPEPKRKIYESINAAPTDATSPEPPTLQPPTPTEVYNEILEERKRSEQERWLPKPRTHRKKPLRSSSTPPAERHRKAIEKHLKGRGARPNPTYRKMRKKKTSKEELENA